MEPIFALSLSFEGIALLRKTQAGWIVVGEAALDTADLHAALADLIEKAGPNSTQVKLVIPNEQIRYLDFAETGAKGQKLHSQVMLSLDGATPYAVADLSFDYAELAGRIYVAAVARETLDEALGFATAHGFKPVSFCAIAAEGTFSGEVFFGPAKTWDGASPLRASEAIRIVAAPPAPEPVVAEAPVADPVEVIPEPAEQPAKPTPVKETPVEKPAKVIAKTPDAPLPEVKEKTKESKKTSALKAPAADAETLMETTPVNSGAPSVSAPGIEEPTAVAPAFTSIRASRGATETKAPRLNGAVPVDPASVAAPVLSASLSATDKTASNGVPSFKSKPVFGAPEDTDAAEKDIAAVAEPRKPGRAGGFFSRRSTAKDAPDTPAPIKKPAKEAVKGNKPKQVLTSALAARRKAEPVPETADALPDEITPEVVAAQERQRMTVFGAREPAKIGGKPRFFGLLLTSILLLFLAGVAAWASVFLDEGLARFFPSVRSSEQIATVDGTVAVPTVQTSEIDDAATVKLASLSPDIDSSAQPGAGLLTDAVNQPVTPEVLSTEQAVARYAATGIWQRAPLVPLLPDMVGLGEVYSASIDPSVEQLDAVALQGPKSHSSDSFFVGLADPAPAGTVFDLDPRGLVIAKAEGALNPEGILVYAGKPPVTPPPRPPEAALLAEDPALLAERVRLQTTRPKLRPGNVVEGNERSLLAGRSRDELAAIRPQQRPVTEKQLAEADTVATAQAVAASRKPIPRPRNFAATVKKAEVTQVAAVKPKTVKPSIPSSASVTKQATVKNAINLKKVNLMGVYGKPSSRRALVRLSNGRFKKVKVGDRIDGGSVAAIGEAELRYVKSGRNVVLTLPKG